MEVAIPRLHLSFIMPTVQHILICHNFNSFSYAANSVALAYKLATEGHRVVFLSHDSPENTIQLPANLTVVQWPGNRPVGWQAFRFVWRIIRQYKIDTVLAHAAASNIVGLVSWLLRVPKRIGYYHSIYASTVIDNAQSTLLTRLKKWRKQFFIHRYTHMICVSHHASDDLQLHFHVPSSRISVVYNSLADRGNDVLPAKATTSPITFFLPTRLDPGKNILAVADGFLHFQQNSSKETRLLIAGMGLQEKLIQEKAGGSGGLITFLGFLSYQEIDKYMQQAHFVVCSTLYEAFGMVNIEAMMLGTPVIASNIGGIPEIVTDGETGLLVDGNSAEHWQAAFAKACHLFLAEREKYERIRQQARQHFTQSFTQPQQLQQLHKLILED